MAVTVFCVGRLFASHEIHRQHSSVRPENYRGHFRNRHRCQQRSGVWGRRERGECRTDEKASATTNDTGFYRIVNLSGPYRVSVELRIQDHGAPGDGQHCVGHRV